MIVPEDKTILKNKIFIGVFAIGVTLALVGVIVRGIYTNQADSCIDQAICTGDTLCLQNGYLYCCSSYRYGPYSCGSYSSGCSQYGYYGQYTDCDGLIVTQWVMFSLACVALIALIVIYKKHLMQRRQNFATEVMHGQNNVIYSDSHQQPPRAQPQQPDYPQQQRQNTNSLQQPINYSVHNDLNPDSNY